jgi:hypothetical protein
MNQPRFPGCPNATCSCAMLAMEMVHLLDGKSDGITVISIGHDGISVTTLEQFGASLTIDQPAQARTATSRRGFFTNMPTKLAGVIGSFFGRIASASGLKTT